MPWVTLVVAGLYEIGWAIGLRYTEGFTRPWPTVWTVLSIINAFREMTAVGIRSRVALMTLLAVSLLGPVAACTGYYFLQDQAGVTASIMTFAGGGIMYLIFQDIAPQSKIRKHWIPALGAVLGFTVGMIGKQLID